MTLSALITLGIRASLVLLVVGAGLTAAPGDATSLLRVPTRFLRSMTAMLLIVPLFALMTAHLFELEPAAAISIAALAVSPVPSLWPRPRYRITGRDSSTLGVLVASALVAVVLLPAALASFGSILSMPLDFPTAQVAMLVINTVLVPLFAGIGIARLLPEFACRVAQGVTGVAMWLLVISAIPLVVRGWPDLSSLVGEGAMLAMVGITLVGLGAGYLLGGPSDHDRSVLAFMAASRHPGLPILIAQTILPQVKEVPAAVALYLLVSVFVCLPHAWWRRRQLRRQDETPLIALR